MPKNRTVVALVAATGLACHARADVIISCDVSGVVRFVHTEERSVGAPRGRTGLHVTTEAPEFSVMNAMPPGAADTTADAWYKPFLWSDAFLPNPGDDWGAGAAMTLALSDTGYASVANHAALDFTFDNNTGGASIYALDLAIDWVLRFRVGSDNDGSQTTALFASAAATTHVGDDLSIFEGPAIAIDTDAPETVIRGTSLAHIEVGSLTGSASSQTAHLHLSFTIQGYVSQVPTPTGALLIGFAAGPLVLRRRRR